MKRFKKKTAGFTLALIKKSQKDLADRTFKVRDGYKSAHWINGGTGLTNFSNEQLPLYQKAVKAHGDPSFFISNVVMAGRIQWDGCSLHHSKREDAGKFWKVFRRLQREER